MISAHGKIILCGEHAVVHGHPALAAAIDRGVRISWQGRPSGPTELRVPHWDLAVTIGDPHPLAEALEVVARAVRADHLSLELDAVAELPPAAGLGSSAALLVAATRALAAAAGRRLAADEVCRIANLGERSFHGNPSGLDVALAAGGGFAIYRKDHGLTALAAAPLPLVVGLSGEPRRTADQVARVSQALLDRPAETAGRLAELGGLADDGRAALVAGDLVGLGRVMQQAQHGLASLGLSSRGLDLLLGVAAQTGALGAKLTGAGGGGAVIALCPGRESELARAWQALGRQAFVVTAGATP